MFRSRKISSGSSSTGSSSTGTFTFRSKLESSDVPGTASQSGYRLILGVDYGTTSTGVSYVTSNKSTLKDVIPIQIWPGEGGPSQTNFKTPSTIAYSRENTNLALAGDKWGFEIDSSMVSYTWTKLLLDRSSDHHEHDDPSLQTIVGQGLMKTPAGKSAKDVCTDYLTHVYKYVMSEFAKQFTERTLAITPMDCWVTIPAIWSEKAKVATLTAARDAGFGSRAGDKVFLIREPEAAAVAVLKDYAAPGAINPVKPGDNVMVVDCGGGTVDIITYTISEVYPILKFEELLSGVGGKCGSTYIDRNFHKLMLERFGGAFRNAPLKQKGPGSRLMARFEAVKRNFGHGEADDVRPVGPIFMQNVRASPSEYDSEDQNVFLTKTDLESLFKPVVDQIIELVNTQVQRATTEAAHSIDRIVLVGGFGDSPYLNKIFKPWCESRNIQLMCPEHCQAAISRGAALRGLTGASPMSTRSRMHWGIVANQIFRPYVDEGQPTTVSVHSGETMCTSRVSWVVSKGQIVKQDFEETHGLHWTIRANNFGSQRGPKTYLELVGTTLDYAPDFQTLERVNPVCTVVCDWSEIDTTSIPHTWDKGIKWYNADFEVKINFGSKEGVLLFTVWSQGKKIGTGKPEFNQD